MIAYAPGPLDLSRLWTFDNFTGASGGSVWPRHESLALAFMLGMLLVTYTITGFDASAHVSEDTVDPSLNARRGILYSVVLSVIFGYLLTCAFVLALPDVAEGASKGTNVFSWLLTSSKMPPIVRYSLYLGIILANFLCGLAGLTSCSRMMFAFARDDGLPMSQRIKSVNNGNPKVAMWISAVLALACTLYGGTFLVLAAGSAVLLYISYVMPIASTLFTTRRVWRDRQFNLGVLSKPAAVFAILGGLVLTIVGILPPNEQVGKLIGGMLALMGAMWLLVERRRFRGPSATAAN